MYSIIHSASSVFEIVLHVWSNLLICSQGFSSKRESIMHSLPVHWLPRAFVRVLTKNLVTSLATSWSESFYSLSVFYRDFDVEGDSQDCPDDSDFTEVYNGIASWSKIIGRYCGSVIPPAITSDSNKLRIEFHSNTQYAGRGFDAMYSLKAIGEQGIYVCYYYY